MRYSNTTLSVGISNCRSFTRLLQLSAIALSLSSAPLVMADGEVTLIESHFEASTPFQYIEGGVNYQWGSGQDQILDGFYFKGHRHSQITSADKVILQRVDIEDVATGEPCGIFAQSSTDTTELESSYPLDDRNSSGNCDMAAALAGRVINRGALDTFSNTGPAPKNIERVDFIYKHGLLASLSDAGLDVGGHVVAEKRGNNAVKIAAISALDDNGQPSAYGPLITVNAVGCTDPDICYGITTVGHDYSFLQSASINPQQYAVLLSGETENLAMAFVSSRHLGLGNGQRYYGVSIFARDVDASVHDLLNPKSFPQNTADDFITLGDSADLYGGMGSAYWDNDSSIETVGTLISGDAFVDSNGNGILDGNELSLSGLSITLYADSDDSRVFDQDSDQALLVAQTDSSGSFLFPGIPDGYYFVFLDESGNSIPSGLSVPPGSNPIGFIVQNGQYQALNFAFTSLSSDGVVEAVEDSATVRQDTSITLDVLANDLDPVGSGLTISALSSATQGIVTIENNQVVFRPNAGFSGTDTFDYTVTDGNSNSSTTTVTIEVLRFSDINNNGLDDYEECSCTNIELITGVHGAGTGGGIALWFVTLILIPPFRKGAQAMNRRSLREA